MFQLNTSTCSACCCCWPQVAEVSEGELFRVETVDWTGGQIADDDSAEDIKTVDLSQVGAAVITTVTNNASCCF
jgi:acetamidase/formamidase